MLRMRWIILWIALWWGISAASAELTLRRIDDGGAAEPVISLRTEGLVTASSAIAPAQIAASHWALSGDLREHADLIDWTPAYRILRVGSDSSEAQSYRASVNVLWRESEPGGLTVYDAWKSAKRAPGLLVIAWVVDGNVRWVKTCWSDGRSGEQDDRVAVGFELTAREAKGVPVVLFMNAKGWVPPKPSVSRKDNAAFQAVMWDDLTALKAELARGARALRPVRDGASLLSFAAGAGRTAVLRALIESTTSQDRGNLDEAETAAIWAAERGRTQAIELLLDAGVTFDGASNWSAKPLQATVAGNHGELFRTLLEQCDQSGGRLAVALAVATGRLEWVKDAVARHPAFMLDRREKAAALYSQVRIGNVAMVEWLLQQGAEDLTDDAVSTNAGVLSRSIQTPPGLSRELYGWMAAMPDVTNVSAGGLGTTYLPQGLPSIQSPVLQGRPMPLPERRTVLVVPTTGIESPLVVAARRQDSAIAELLLSHGMDPNEPSQIGATALMIASRDGNLPLALRLLAAGADPRATMDGGWSALHFAALSDVPALCSALLTAGADVRAPDETGLTPVVAAWRAGAFRTASMLAQIDPEAVQPGEWVGVLAQRAIAVDALELLTCLVERVPDCRVSAKLSLLDAATLVGASRCVDWLKTQGSQERDVSLVEANDVAGLVKVKKSEEPLDPRIEYLRYDEVSILVSFVIDRDGSVLLAGVDSNVPPLLRISALRAIENWTFEPLKLNGKSVRTRAQYRFNLPALDRELRPDSMAEQPSLVGGSKHRFPNVRGKGPGLIEFTVDVDGYASDVVLLQADDLQLAAAFWVGVLSAPVLPAESEGRKLNSRRLLSWHD